MGFAQAQRVSLPPEADVETEIQKLLSSLSEEGSRERNVLHQWNSDS